MSDQTLEVQFIDTPELSDKPHLRTFWCPNCFKEVVGLLSNNFDKLMCRKCGDTWLVRGQRE